MVEEGMKYILKTEIIKEFNDAYAKNDLKRCESSLLHLILIYNKEIREDEQYNHDLKHLLFRCNCIRNPIGIKYTIEDYKKTIQILDFAIVFITEINNTGVNSFVCFQEGFTIDNRIKKDILDIKDYTECFYKMNSVNSARMDECEVGKIPFVEQLINLLLFYQDQISIARENYRYFVKPSGITGMELSIANTPVKYYDNLFASISDNFETILESMNEIIHFLYYRFGASLETIIKDTDIQCGFIHPYENVEFEKYLYIAAQRYSICRIEEGIRYGYYKTEYTDKTKEGIERYFFSLESDEKHKARSMGILRREYQIRKYTLIDGRNQIDLTTADEKLMKLAEELTGLQEEKNVLFDFSKFHPGKELFEEAEKVSKIKERIVEALTKNYYLNCNVKGVKVRDLLVTYSYLYTLSEILYFALIKYIDDKRQETYIKEISLVDISYLSKELSRIHGFKNVYADQLIDRFVFHEKGNRDEDIFSQPLLKISKNQVVLCQALLD